MMEAVASSGGMSYADSLDSSPRSRGGESWDEPAPAPAAKHRLMCSYGGRIVPRPTDKSLCYLGGETRMVVVDRHASLADLSARLSSTLLSGRPFTLKYQLPNEDLDSLISLTTDEDLDNMFEEYDRIASSSRLRLFLFPSASPASSADDSASAKSDSWFVDALNGAVPAPMPAAPRLDVNSLLGLQDAAAESSAAAPPQVLDTSSSFGSACSAPSVSNLPPIRTRPDRLEHQFANAKLSTEAPPAAPPAENPDQIFSTGEDKMEVPPPVKPFVAEDPPVVDSTVRPVYYQDTSPPAPTVPPLDRKHDMPIADSSYHGYLMPQMQQEQLQQQQQQQRYYHQQPQQFIHPNPHYIHSASGTVLPMPSYYPPIQQSQQYDSQAPMYFMPVRPSTPYNLAPVQPNVGDAVPPVVKPAAAPLPSKAELAANLYRSSVASAPAQSMPQAPLLHLAADQAHPYASMGYHHMMQQHPSQTGATMVSHGYEYSDPSQQPRVYYTQNAPPAMYASQYQTMASAPVIPDVAAASQMQPSDAKQTRAQ